MKQLETDLKVILKMFYLVYLYSWIIKVNEISSLEELGEGKLLSLRTLELRKNKLGTTAGICLPLLTKLYLVRLQYTMHLNTTSSSGQMKGGGWLMQISAQTYEYVYWEPQSPITNVLCLKMKETHLVPTKHCNLVLHVN